MSLRRFTVLAVAVIGLTGMACDAPERTTRTPGVVAPGPKGDDTQDGKPGSDEEAPFFVQPDESEATVALNSGKCVEVRMELSDDAEELDITVDVPAEITGATLTEDARGFAARWRWCPGAFGQPPKAGAYEITLLADDGIHLPTAKPYTVVVAEAEPEPEPEPQPEPDSCDQGWPTVDYQPAAVVDDVATISALFKDDQGIVGFPIIEVTFEAPDEIWPETTAYPMELLDGDRTAGLWVIDIPMHGETMYYRYVAEDSIPGQPCPHLLEEPADGFIELAP